MEVIMCLFIKKYNVVVFFLLIFAVCWSALFSPLMTPVFMAVAIFFSLAISIFFILEKHKGSENLRQKIAADILVLIVVLVLAILLGGACGLWAGKQVEGRFGVLMGVLCALAVSFAVGYWLQKGMRKLVR
jgi:hypothetical protein